MKAFITSMFAFLDNIFHQVFYPKDLLIPCSQEYHLRTLLRHLWYHRVSFIVLLSKILFKMSSCGYLFDTSRLLKTRCVISSFAQQVLPNLLPLFGLFCWFHIPTVSKDKAQA